MHAYLLSVGLTLFSWSAFAVDGTNLPGHDYADFNAPSAFVCRTSCGGEARCQAYTWVKPGIQGPSGHCWLKDTLPNIVKDACCDSTPRRFISKRDLQAEDKINRPGSDFINFNADSWRTCEAASAEALLGLGRNKGQAPSWECPIFRGKFRPRCSGHRASARRGRESRPDRKDHGLVSARASQIHRCWLKNRVARPVADGNTVSGVKFRPASVRID